VTAVPPFMLCDTPEPRDTCTVASTKLPGNRDEGEDRMASTSVRIDVSESVMDAEQTQSATILLRDELLRLDVDSVDFPVAGAPPAGAKAGAELAVIGTLLLTVSNPALLSAVVKVIKSWIERSSERTARLEIDGDVLDVRGISRSEQRLLIEQWLARHNGSGD
jgi:hypothetical protein